MTPEELKRLHDETLKPSSPYDNVPKRGGFSFWLLAAGLLLWTVIFKKGK